MRLLTNFFLFLLFFLAAGLILFLGYTGFLPGVSAFFEADKPKDLGIVFDSGTLESANNKTKVKVENSTGMLEFSESILCLGSHPVFTVFTSEELTSLVNNDRWIHYPVSGMQMKINDDGTLQASGILLTSRIEGFMKATGRAENYLPWHAGRFELPFFNPPFYFFGSVKIENNQVSLDIKKLTIGKLSIPRKLIKNYSHAFEGFIEERLNFLPGFYVYSLSFSDAGMEFSGKLPDRMIFGFPGTR